MSGVFFIILVPFLISMIAILMTSSSKGTYTGGGGGGERASFFVELKNSKVRCGINGTI
jgi:hypothetical protein